jgi:proteasome lid subunit RPN8/RPN11
MEIVLPAGVRGAMERDAEARAPAEACGLLVGRKEKARPPTRPHFASEREGWGPSRIVAEEARPTTNRLGSPVRFEIPPEELYRAWMEAEKRGKEVVAVYHSHPAGAPAFPSQWDLPYLREGGLPWVILSLSGQEVRAFVWEDGVREVPIRPGRR